MSRKWRRFVLRRVIRLAVVTASLIVATFAMIHLVPGEPARAIAGANAGHAAVEHIRNELGLNKPIYEQFATYVSGLAHGNLGRSFVTKEPVINVIGNSVGPTLQVALIGGAIIFVVGIALGLVGGVYTESGRRSVEIGFSGLTGIMSGLPDYLTATFLAFVFAVSLRWLPVAGAGTLLAALLPAVAVSVRPTAMVSRLARVQTLEVLEQDYIRTARSKRLRRGSLYLRHVLPNVLTAALTVGGIAFASLVGGTIVVEQVFARPGLGTELVQAVLVKNYPVVEGVTLVFGLTIVVVNTLIDATLAIVDPRTLDGER